MTFKKIVNDIKTDGLDAYKENAYKVLNERYSTADTYRIIANS